MANICELIDLSGKEKELWIIIEAIKKLCSQVLFTFFSRYKHQVLNHCHIIE